MPQRKHASGKHSKAICDRCGAKHDYDRLILEWTGLRVCPLCHEPKHPQLEPRVRTDAQAVRHARPDRDDMGTVEQQLDELFPHTAGTGGRG